MTAKQETFIRTLIAERELTADARENALKRLDEGLTVGLASRWIERLLELPKLPSARGRGAVDHKNVPAGRYAIEGADELEFYKVDRPDEGDYAGMTFVKLIVGGGIGGRSVEHRIGRPRQQAVIDAIAAEGAELASARYGHELGHCGVCGRELTKDESRERGIGPVCAGKLGW